MYRVVRSEESRLRLLDPVVSQCGRIVVVGSFWYVLSCLVLVPKTWRKDRGRRE